MRSGRNLGRSVAVGRLIRLSRLGDDVRGIAAEAGLVVNC
jgi:hypothetical protein